MSRCGRVLLEVLVLSISPRLTLRCTRVAAEAKSQAIGTWLATSALQNLPSVFMAYSEAEISRMTQRDCESSTGKSDQRRTKCWQPTQLGRLRFRMQLPPPALVVHGTEGCMQCWLMSFSKQRLIRPHEHITAYSRQPRTAGCSCKVEPNSVVGRKVLAHLVDRRLVQISSDHGS